MRGAGRRTLLTGLGSRLLSRSQTALLRRMTDLHLRGRRPVTRREELELRQAMLSEPYGPWPAGTEGVIVDAFETDAVFEILNEDGETLDVLTIGWPMLTLLEKS